MAKRFADTYCPQCDILMNVDTQAGVYRCPQCFHRIDLPLESLDQAIERRHNKQIVAHISHRGTVQPRAKTLFESGVAYLAHENIPAALRAWQDAVNLQPDFVDGYLWIAKTSADDAVKLKNLEHVLALNPGHTEAIQLLLALRGELTPEMSAAANDAYRQPVEKTAPIAVPTATDTLLCNVCGGHLTVDEDSQTVLCRFCGFTQSLTLKRGASLLTSALLQERAKPVRWNIGKRKIHCDRCGAERTVTAQQMSDTCTFCNSTQVIVQDALNTIRQPDGIVPFAISEEQAVEAIRTRLKQTDQRISGWFNENRVARKILNGVYLPYWVFDAYADVHINQQLKEDYVRRYGRGNFQNKPILSESQRTDGVLGLSVCAVHQPPNTLTRHLKSFSLETMIGYNPRLLARYPASIYDVNFIDASLKARSAIQQVLQKRHSETSTSTPYETRVMVHILQMTFMLILMPVWIVQLHERDQDVRPVLVHGLTGQVVLGKAQKPS